MLSGISIHTDDLKWLVPMIVGAIALIGCVVAFIVRPNRDWTLVVLSVLAVALIGASVFTKISFTKEGVTIETAQLSAKILEDLQTASKSNSEAIGQLTVRLDQLTAVTRKVAETQPEGLSHTAELNKIVQDTQKIRTLVKDNDIFLNSVAKNTSIYKSQIEQIKTPF